MTLIISVASHFFVAMLSDRRITTPVKKPDGNTTYVFKDSDTKSVVMNGTHVLGFAGLGTVGEAHQRMEYWILEQFAGHLTAAELRNWPDILATAFGATTEHIGYRRPHVFLAPGFDQQQDGTLRPEIIKIQNAVYPNSFDISRRILEQHEAFALEVGGVQLAPEDWQHFIDRLQAMANEPVIDLGQVTELMMETWARTAAKNETVGPTAILTTVPATAVPALAGVVPLGSSAPDVMLNNEVSMTLSLEQGEPAFNRYSGPARVIEGVVFGGAEARTPAASDEGFYRMVAISFGDLEPQTDEERQWASGRDRTQGAQPTAGDDEQ